MLSEVSLMDVPLAGAEYTSQAVEALIEKPNALHRIHQCQQMRAISAKWLPVRWGISRWVFQLMQSQATLHKQKAGLSTGLIEKILPVLSCCGASRAATAGAGAP